MRMSYIQMYGHQWDKKKKAPKVDGNGNLVPSTAHSKHPVPFIIMDPQNGWTINGSNGTHIGGLAQIGATLLKLCDVPIPNDYLPELVQPI